MQSSSQFRGAGPPALTSAAWAADFAPAGGYQVTSTFVNPGGPATRTFNSFSQAVDEIVEARIWAGLHFRTADVLAVQLGTNVANYAAANYFEPVGNH